jgi:hypothetical protein
MKRFGKTRVQMTRTLSGRIRGLKADERAWAI